MSTIDSNGVKIYYEVAGEGPAILLTHGYGAMGKMWGPQTAAISVNHKMITWDIRGHGRSDSPDDQAEYTETKAVSDMKQLLDTTGTQKAVIGGLSLGGYLSLAFHYVYPDRVRALVLCDTGPGFKDKASRQKWNDRSEATARDFEKDGLAALAKREHTSVKQHRSAVGLIRSARGMFRQYDSRIIESLPNINVPTLVVIGENDAPLMNGCQYMARKIPRATLVIVPRSGHYPNIDEPAIFNDVLSKFLAQLLPE
jgi:pimeloyl-ACP methyl ester carboxylesterase